MILMRRAHSATCLARGCRCVHVAGTGVSASVSGDFAWMERASISWPEAPPSHTASPAMAVLAGGSSASDEDPRRRDAAGTRLLCYLHARAPAAAAAAPAAADAAAAAGAARLPCLAVAPTRRTHTA